MAIHVPCTSKKMGATAGFESLAAKCAKEVVPSGVPCCGMAGDRGMRYPELTGGALQHLSVGGCSDGRVEGGGGGGFSGRGGQREAAGLARGVRLRTRTPTNPRTPPPTPPL